MKNRFLTLRLVLLLFMLLGTVQIAFSQRSFYQDGIYYQVTGRNTVAVYTPWQGYYRGNIVIPSEVKVLITGGSNSSEEFNNNYIVTSVSSQAFYNCTDLTGIELPPTVKTIGNYAFYGCSRLTNVSLSNGLDSIKNSAFQNCKSLQSIALPNSVRYLGSNVFYSCSALANVTLSKNIMYLDKTFFGCSSLESIDLPSATISLWGTFTGCSQLKSVTIPNSVSNIGENAFKDCSALTSINLPNSVEVIGEYAFANTGLSSVSFPSTVTTIGKSAFYGCNQLASVTVRPVTPPSMTNQNSFTQWTYDNAKLNVPQVAIDVYKSKDWWKLFKDVSGDSSFNFSYDFASEGIYYNIVDDNNVEVTYKDASYNSYSGSVAIPENVTFDGKTYHVTSIGRKAFWRCSGLTNVTLPSSLTTIAANAFNGCIGLTSLTIPQNVSSIGSNAFGGCSGLTQLTWNARDCLSNGDMLTGNIDKVTIGNSVVTLPVSFVSNSKITEVSIPGTVKNIGGGAFNGCASLTSLTIPKSVSYIGDKAFSGCTSLTSLTWNACECWFNGDMITSNISQVVIGNEVKVLPIGFVANSKITSVNIPSSVKSIGGDAFYQCQGITNITLPEGLENIGECAFCGLNAISSLTIPSSIEAIGSSAFRDCTGLKTIYYNAKSIESFAPYSLPFDNCPIEHIVIGESVARIPSYFACYLTELTEINIPNSVTSIGEYAFGRCSALTSIYLPDGITSIEEGTFCFCSSLSSVRLGADITSIGESAFESCTSLADITIPNSVTHIGGYAFERCTGLTSIDLPDGVTSIEYGTFWNCSALSSVRLGADVTSIGRGAFYDCTNLQTFTCLSITPPDVVDYYYSFYGVPQSMTVYVPAVALESYKNNYYWSRFTILPIGFNLTVNLPDAIDCSEYANMDLEIENPQDNKTAHFVVTNNRNYRFAGLEDNTTWNVTLTNQYGDVFGKIENVNVGEEDVTVTFPSLLKPQDVTLTVKTPNGQDVTSQCKVSWLDEKGELLTQGNQIGKLPAGRKLKYQVTLPQELATAYTMPATNTYTVKSGSNEVVCQLVAISQTQLSGKVKDATDNQPLYGATISAVQSFGGDVTKTITAKTDHQGQYSLDVSSVPTTLTVAASGYMSQTVECDMTGGNTVVVPDVTLDPITGVVIDVNLTYTPAHLESEPAEVQNWYSDYSNVDYEVYNKTTGHTMTGVHVQYPQIVLTEDVNDGDVLELTATSRKDAFKPVKTTVTIAEQRATATFNILEKGKLAAKFRKNINPSVVGTLYDADKKLVKSDNYTGETMTIDNLADGNYKLISMGKSDFFNSIYDMDQFAATGLQSGVDYAENTVTVANGLVTPVNINEVPFLDETKLYYTGEKTSFTVNKSNIVIGNYLTFRAEVDFKEAYKDKVNDVQIIVDLPESCHFYEYSVMVGSNMSDYTVEDNRIVIPIANYENNAVRFCAIPTVPGDFNPSAFARFKLNGKTITQPIGKATFTAEGLSINTVSHSADTTIQVNGSGFAAALVKIYDGKVQIGQTKCRADGNWTASVNLYKPYSHSYHHIQAEIETLQGLTLSTENKIVEYDKNAPQLRTISMLNNGNHTIVFDQISGTTDPGDYFASNTPFTFIAKFDRNDTTLIKNLIFKVLCENGVIYGIDGYFNESTAAWIGAGYFNSSPINVAAEFDVVNNSSNVDTAMVAASLEWENSIIRRFVESLESADTRITIVNDKEFMAVVKLPSNDSICCVVKEVPMNSISDLESNGYHFQDLNSDIWISPSKDTDNSIYLWNSDGSYLITFIDYDHNDYNENNSKILAPPRNPLQRIIAFINGSPFFGDNNHVHGIDYYEFLLYDWYPAKCNQFYSNLQRLSNLISATCPDGSLKLDKYYIDLYQIGWELYNSKCDEFRSEIKSALENYREKINNRHAINVAMQLLSLGLSGMGVGGEVFNTWINSSLPRASIAFFAESFATNYFANAVSDLDEGAIEGFSAEERLWKICYDKSKDLQDSFINLKRRIVSSYKQCGVEEIPDFSEFFCPPVTPMHDPSGFVYEGVPSNRLQGVTATCYYKETVEDMYGDEHEEVVLWDAEQYGQENPLLTDENGFYRWDVPIGQWQVKYEKEGYETTYSDWLPVPPPQLDVNIGMVQMRQPEVIKARAYPKAVEFEFDKFMFPETLTNDNITVSVNGTPVSGSIELLNAEVDDPLAITSIRRAPGTGLTFASRVRFNANSSFNADKVTLHVKKVVKSYADLEMNEDYEITLPVEFEMEKIVADSTVNVLYGDSRELTVTVSPAAASKGKTLTVRSIAPMIATTDAETYTLNSNGQAVITVHGDLPGMTSLVFGIDGYDLTASTLVNVLMESQMTVATPTATIATGSTVEEGTAVYLRCATEGATIYYTLDGSCPCDPSPARKIYDGSPIIINGTVTIKAMATAPDLYDSDVATFVYRVGSGLKGDVNGDGEVNIADVNALIDIIAGGAADADTRYRADVNGDGEVNIADINAVIDIILNPANNVGMKVNCDDLLHIDDVTMKPGDVRTLKVTLDRAARYSAVQCDLVLPAGLTLVDAHAVGANVMRMGSMDDFTNRVLSYSMSKLPFISDSQPVMTITVRADATLASESEITLTHVVLADAANKAWRTGDAVARVNNATGITDVTATAGRVWVEKRTLCIETGQGGIARIVGISGMVRDLDVQPGITRHELDPGIYVVILGAQSYKIAVR